MGQAANKRNWTWLLALMVVPLDQPQGWHDLKYRGLEKNRVEIGSAGVRITVRSSASPLFFVLPRTAQAAGFKVSGDWKGQFRVPDGRQQGEKGFDDFVLRLGLVVPGGKTLSLLQRWTSPEWVKTLFRLAPEGRGLDRVEFFNAVVDPGLIGLRRDHPAHDLLKENFTWELRQPGSFSFGHRLKDPLPVAALWIGSDGDDTGSSFELRLQSLELEVSPP